MLQYAEHSALGLNHNNAAHMIGDENKDETSEKNELAECKQKPISRTVVHCLDSRKRSLYVYLFLFFVHI